MGARSQGIFYGSEISVEVLESEPEIRHIAGQETRATGTLEQVSYLVRGQKTRNP